MAIDVEKVVSGGTGVKRGKRTKQHDYAKHLRELHMYCEIKLDVLESMGDNSPKIDGMKEAFTNIMGRIVK